MNQGNEWLSGLTPAPREVAFVQFAPDLIDPWVRTRVGTSGDVRRVTRAKSHPSEAVARRREDSRRMLRAASRMSPPDASGFESCEYHLDPFGI